MECGQLDRQLCKQIAELIDQLNREGDFAILSTAKTKIALSRFKGLRALTNGLNRDT
jgi:ABC-type ATPase involved in cell division